MFIKLIIPLIESDDEPERWGSHFQAKVTGINKYSAVLCAAAILAGFTPKRDRYKDNR